MRLVLACLIVLTSTAAAAPAPTPPPAPAITAQDLRDVIDGRREPDELTAQIPMKDRIDAIHRLIRAGASCKPSTDGCIRAGNYEPPDEKSTSKSPCFRRWHLYVLLYDLPVDGTFHLDASELRAAAKLDDDLLGFIGGNLDQKQEIELARLLHDKNRAVPFSMFLDDAIAVKAVKQYHLDEAVPSIDAQASRGVLIGVALDGRYKAATRIDVIDRLVDSSGDDDPIFTILRPLIGDSSIEVAAAVAARTGADLRRPPTANAAVFMRALALFAQTSSDDLQDAATYAPRGLDIVSPSGEKLSHVDDLAEVAREINIRIRSEPPLLGTDAHGQIILRGFVDVPEPDALDDVCDPDVELEGPYKMVP